VMVELSKRGVNGSKYTYLSERYGAIYNSNCSFAI